MTAAIGDLTLENFPLEAARPEQQYGPPLSPLPWNLYIAITKPRQEVAKIRCPTLGSF